jgi:hypothetical protein
MAAVRLIEYEDASPEVQAVYDDIMTTRKVDAVNNFWKAIANDPAMLRRTWESLKQIMQPGALDPLTKGAALYCCQRFERLRVLHRLPHSRCQEAGDDGRHIPRTDGRDRHGQRNESTGDRVSSGDRPEFALTREEQKAVVPESPSSANPKSGHQPAIAVHMPTSGYLLCLARTLQLPTVEALTAPTKRAA